MEYLCPKIDIHVVKMPGVFVMDIKYGVLTILAVCGLVLLIGIMRRKAEIVLRFFTRMVVGFAVVYVVNTILKNQGISLAVGFNPISALTLGTLGFPGVVLLYGVLLLDFL